MVFILNKELINDALSFLAGLYFAYTLSRGLYLGEFTMLKSWNTVTVDGDPDKFWAVVWLQAIICFLLFYISLWERIKKHFYKKK